VSKRSLLIATTNPGKLREVMNVLSDLPLDFVALDVFPGLPPFVETGATFEQNAIGKAGHYASRTGLWTLADDSGLEVEALGGAPGVHSARFAGPERDDAANNAKLILALADVPAEKRTARFRCCLALADRGALLACETGSVEGRIIDSPRGSNGFGYDPHFFVPELGKTLAEFDLRTKNEISHRGRSLRRMRPHLVRLLHCLPTAGDPLND
jgi:XTP/dITP diphosphohydrolase